MITHNEIITTSIGKSGFIGGYNLLKMRAWIPFKVIFLSKASLELKLFVQNLYSAVVLVTDIIFSISFSYAGWLIELLVSISIFSSRLQKLFLLKIRIQPELLDSVATSIN